MSKVKAFFVLVVSLVGWWLGNKVSWQVRADTAGGKGFSQVLDGFLNDVTQRPTHVSLERVDVLAGLGVVAALALVWAYQAGARKPSRVGEEQGSAKWGTPRQIRGFVGDRRTDVLFTRSESLSLDSRKTQRNLNALVIGSSGSGKSRYFVMPNLYQATTSFLVTDPKGEVMAATGQHLVDAGYEVRCLNLIDFARSDCFNALAYFNPEQAEVDCAILTENFIANTTGQKPGGASGGGDFWERAERALLTAFIAYVYFTKGPEGSLVDVVDMLAEMSASEQDEKAMSEVDALFAATKEYIDDFEADPKGYDEEAAAMLEGLRFAWSQYNVYTQGAGETRKSVIISLGVRMAPLHMSSLRRVLGSDTIQADKIGSRKTALFLVVPDTHQTFSFLASIFYETFFERNLYLADHNGGRLDVEVQCYMDEFANIGKMPSFERKIAVMRSRGISCAVIVQNYSQGKALYRDSWETIVGNCDSLLFLGGNEQSTTEFISKRLGKETIINQDTSEQKGTNGSWSKSLRSLGRELLTPDEVARLPGQECLYLLRGLPPFRSRKLQAPQTGAFSYVPVPASPVTQAPDLGQVQEDRADWTQSGEDAPQENLVSMSLTWPDGRVEEELLHVPELWS